MNAYLCAAFDCLKFFIPGWEIPTKSMDPLIVDLKALFELTYNGCDFRRSLLRRVFIATTLALSAATTHALTVTEATQYWGNSVEGRGSYSSREAAAVGGVAYYCAHPAYPSYSGPCSYGGIDGNDWVTVIVDLGAFQLINVYQYYACPAATQIFNTWTDNNGVRYTPACVNWAASPPPPPPPCPVADLPPITDPDVQAFEDNPDRSDTARLTPRMQTALQCLKTATADGSPKVGSAYRPSAYNQHLIDVWLKWRELRTDTNPACTNLKAKIQQHFQRHRLLVSQPPVLDSRHTQGLAVDVTINLPSANIDALAGGCGLRRPLPILDRVHFQFP